MSKKVIYAHLSSLSTSELKQLSLLLDPKVCSKKEVILIHTIIIKFKIYKYSLIRNILPNVYLMICF